MGLRPSYDKIREMQDNKKTFIKNFTSNFICHWMAIHYDKHSPNIVPVLIDQMPLEDAKTLAEKTWEKIYGS